MAEDLIAGITRSGLSHLRARWGDGNQEQQAAAALRETPAVPVFQKK
jgi:hypothetical protein